MHSETSIFIGLGCGFIMQFYFYWSITHIFKQHFFSFYSTPAYYCLKFQSFYFFNLTLPILLISYSLDKNFSQPQFSALLYFHSYFYNHYEETNLIRAITTHLAYIVKTCNFKSTEKSNIILKICITVVIETSHFGYCS